MEWRSTPVPGRSEARNRTASLWRRAAILRASPGFNRTATKRDAAWAASLCWVATGSGGHVRDGIAPVAVAGAAAHGARPEGVVPVGVLPAVALSSPFAAPQLAADGISFLGCSALLPVKLDRTPACRFHPSRVPRCPRYGLERRNHQPWQCSLLV